MTNKEKILKAIEQKQQDVWPTDIGEMKPASVPNNLEQGWLNALKWMEDFIKSLPTEQQGENLKKAAAEYAVAKHHDKTLQDIVAIDFIAGAQWQKEQMMKSAIDGCHIKRNGYTQVKVLNGFSTTCEAIQRFKDGDKVKILIIKEDEQ